MLLRDPHLLLLTPIARLLTEGKEEGGVSLLPSTANRCARSGSVATQNHTPTQLLAVFTSPSLLLICGYFFFTSKNGRVEGGNSAGHEREFQ